MNFSYFQIGQVQKRIKKGKIEPKFEFKIEIYRGEKLIDLIYQSEVKLLSKKIESKKYQEKKIDKNDPRKHRVVYSNKGIKRKNNNNNKINNNNNNNEDEYDDDNCDEFD